MDRAAGPCSADGYKDNRKGKEEETLVHIVKRLLDTRNSNTASKASKASRATSIPYPAKGYILAERVVNDIVMVRTLTTGRIQVI